MKNLILRGTYLMIASLVIISCSTDNEDDANIQEQTLTPTELKTILETDDVAGVADTVISELYIGGTTTKSAKSNDCYAAEYSDTGFTVTFNNCVLNGTENVNGTLTVTYATDASSASYTATYTDFYVGEIKLNGTRTYVLNGNADTNSFSFAVTSDMTVVMQNGEVISENGTKTLSFGYDAMTETFQFSLEGNWTVTIGDDTYTVNVTNALEGSFGCGYITAGSMNLNKNGLEVDVDFGDGSCDDIATLTYPDGTTEEFSLKD